jgi:hypothetical protein
MLCLAAWCGLHKQAKKGNTMVFSKLGGKFLGWIQVDQSDNIMDVQTKASKLLPHPLFCHPAYLVVYDATNKRLSPRLTVRISTLKRVFSEVVAVPCTIQVVWDDAIVQQDFEYIESNLPTTTFDGHKITTVVSAKKANVRVPPSIELYSLARSFECRAAQTTGFESVWLRQLCDLETVELTNCTIIDQSNFADLIISKCIKHLSIVLAFSANYMKLDGISSYQSLKVLRLQGTLYGSIPDEVSDLKSLTTLDLAYNKLSGDVRLSGLVNLEELFLQHNKLCGQLFVSTCTKLRRLNVSHNTFEATVLDDIKLCESLQEVDTSHNLF